MDSLLVRILNGSNALRRAAALALTAGAAIVVAAVIVSAVSLLSARADAVREKRIQLGRLQAVVALRPAIERSLAPAEASRTGPEFLAGDSEAVIRASLQTMLDDLARGQGVSVLSVGNAPLVQQGKTRFVGVRAALSGTNDGILGLLRAVELAKPYLTIREARIQSTLEAQQPGQAGPPQLVVQIQLYGALPPEAAAPAPAKAG